MALGDRSEQEASNFNDIHKRYGGLRHGSGFKLQVEASKQNPTDIL